jgi:farnesyl diphosphate synthase
MTDIKEKLTAFSRRFNDRLPEFFTLPAGPEKRVVQAMEYSVMNGGKRLRPFLVCECAALFSVPEEKSFRTAAALEMLHSYSLIHDDLPAMDNDDLRRGKPTCHKQFDEATAILAGDGLLTYAFEIISDEKTHPRPVIRSRLVKLLAEAAGAFNGMIAGQMLDLYAENLKNPAEPEKLIKNIEEMKTGRLLRYACEAGAVLGNAQGEKYQALIDYSRRIGIAFQIADDILDVEGNQALVGKTLNKDAEQGKITFVGTYGLPKAKQIAKDFITEAEQVLDIFGNKARTLKELAHFIIERKS